MLLEGCAQQNDTTQHNATQKDANVHLHVSWHQT